MHSLTSLFLVPYALWALLINNNRLNLSFDQRFSAFRSRDKNLRNLMHTSCPNIKGAIVGDVFAPNAYALALLSDLRDMSGNSTFKKFLTFSYEVSI